MIGLYASTRINIPAIKAIAPKNVAEIATQPSALMPNSIRNAARNNVDKPISKNSYY